MPTTLNHAAIRPRVRTALLGWAAAALALGLPVPVAGQGTAGIIGAVRNGANSQPLGGALARIVETGAEATTDSVGKFQLTGLPTGRVTLEIRLVGYRKDISTFDLAAGQVVERGFDLVFTGEQLPDLVVKESPRSNSGRYSDFERRMHEGRGSFTTWQDILQRGYMTLADALKATRGVKVDCRGQAQECIIYMARARPSCPPTYWVDGGQVYSFHYDTALRDVYGVEVYRGPAEVPPEFGGSSGACGVVVIWTKSSPVRNP